MKCPRVLFLPPRRQNTSFCVLSTTSDLMSKGWRFSYQLCMVPSSLRFTGR